jgi:hypothetical protein
MSGDQPQDSKDLSSLFRLLSFPAVITTPLVPKPVPIFEAMPPFPLETLPPNVRAFAERSAASASGGLSCVFRWATGPHALMVKSSFRAMSLPWQRHL